MQVIDYEIPVREELEPGEKLLWAGRPRPGIVLTGREIPGLIFSLLWCGFMVFWETMALRDWRRGPGVFMALWGVPFVCMGLYLLVGRFLIEAWQRTRTFYAITDHRAIIVLTGSSRRVRSFPFLTMNEVNLEERSNGSGDIWFGSPPVIWPKSREMSPQSPGFMRLEAVREVYRTLLGARDAASRDARSAEVYE